MSRSKAQIKGMVIHCSATKPQMDIGVDEIEQWHLQRGFLEIGYHFIIRRDGTIENGRMIDQDGAHAKGYNRGTIGICLVGGLNRKGKPERNFTNEQEAALIKLVKEMYDYYPIKFIVGHRDLPKVKKECPCFEVDDFLAENGLFGEFSFTKEKYNDKSN